MKKVIVVGCGVSGLSTAICLQENGFAVEIWAEALPPHTTSDKAAAVWFPYAIGPINRVEKWSKQSYDYFASLAKNEATGVSFDDLTLVGHEESEIEPFWSKSLPRDMWSVVGPQDLPAGYKTGYKVRVPIIETPIYMPYLVERFKRKGGKILKKTIASLAELPHDVFTNVNCTGLGARSLAHDNALFPILGLTLVGTLNPDVSSLDRIVDDGGPNSLAYVFPRKMSGDFVLGGTAVQGADESSIEDHHFTEMLERCGNIYPELKSAANLKRNWGLRPGRPNIRLNRDEENPRLIHNYGHGGGGFTVSWGCAFEVLTLIKELDG